MVLGWSSKILQVQDLFVTLHDTYSLFTLIDGWKMLAGQIIATSHEFSPQNVLDFREMGHLISGKSKWRWDLWFDLARYLIP